MWNNSFKIKSIAEDDACSAVIEALGTAYGDAHPHQW